MEGGGRNAETLTNDRHVGVGGVTAKHQYPSSKVIYRCPPSAQIGETITTSDILNDIYLPRLPLLTSTLIVPKRSLRFDHHLLPLLPVHSRSKARDGDDLAFDLRGCIMS